MKTLSKLNINPEKVMKNEELVTLRGGYGGTCGYKVWAYGQWQIDCGVTQEEALLAYGNWGGWWCCDSCSSTSYCGPE
jgi:hypothetical protein